MERVELNLVEVDPSTPLVLALELCQMDYRAAVILILSGYFWGRAKRVNVDKFSTTLFPSFEPVVTQSSM